MSGSAPRLDLRTEARIDLSYLFLCQETKVSKDQNSGCCDLATPSILTKSTKFETVGKTDGNMEYQSNFQTEAK